MYTHGCIPDICLTVGLKMCMNFNGTSVVLSVCNCLGTSCQIKFCLFLKCNGINKTSVVNNIFVGLLMFGHTCSFKA